MNHQSPTDQLALEDHPMLPMHPEASLTHQLTQTGRALVLLIATSLDHQVLSLMHQVVLNKERLGPEVDLGGLAQDQAVLGLDLVHLRAVQQVQNLALAAQNLGLKVQNLDLNLLSPGRRAQNPDLKVLNLVRLVPSQEGLKVGQDLSQQVQVQKVGSQDRGREVHRRGLKAQ